VRPRIKVLVRSARSARFPSRVGELVASSRSSTARSASNGRARIDRAGLAAGEPHARARRERKSAPRQAVNEFARIGPLHAAATHASASLGRRRTFSSPLRRVNHRVLRHDLEFLRAARGSVPISFHSVEARIAPRVGSRSSAAAAGARRLAPLPKGRRADLLASRRAILSGKNAHRRSVRPGRIVKGDALEAHFVRCGGSCQRSRLPRGARIVRLGREPSNHALGRAPPRAAGRRSPNLDNRAHAPATHA